MNYLPSEPSLVQVERATCDGSGPEASAANHEASGSVDGTDREATAELVLDVLPRAMRRIRQVTRRASGGGLTVPQVRALLYIRRHPGTDLSALAVHLGVSRPSASALVDRLVRGDLVGRRQDPRERRRLCLDLTADGQEAAARARLAARQWLAGVLSTIPAADVAALASAMPILDRATGGEFER